MLPETSATTLRVIHRRVAAYRPLEEFRFCTGTKDTIPRKRNSHGEKGGTVYDESNGL